MMLTRNQVVTEQSASIPGWPKIPLPADHLRMAKYDGPHNMSYSKVLSVLKMMARSAPEKIHLRFNPQPFLQDNSLVPVVHLDCMKALLVSWPDTELKSLRRQLGERTPETAEWILTKEEYLNWMHGPQ